MKKLVITQKITSRKSEVFQRYLHEVSKIPLLSEEEEKEIATLAKMGDEDAIEKLVKHNLRFVISVAKQYETPYAPLEDLVNEGNLGIIEAAKRFEVDKNYKFISYAVWWVRRKINDYIINKSKLIRTPGNKRGNINKIKRAMSVLEQILEREPSVEDLVEYLNNEVEEKARTKAKNKGEKFKGVANNALFSTNQVEFLLNIDARKMSYLDQPMDEDGFKLMDVVPNKSSKSTDYLTKLNDKSTNIDILLSPLKDRHRKVMVLLFGLNGSEPLTLKEAGLVLGISRERVRQLRDAAKKIIRKKADENGWGYMIENI